MGVKLDNKAAFEKCTGQNIEPAENSSLGLKKAKSLNESIQNFKGGKRDRFSRNKNKKQTKNDLSLKDQLSLPFKKIGN